MTAKRILRIIAGVLVLAIFCVYTYARSYVSPKTRDLGPAGGTFDFQGWQAPAAPLDPLLERLGIHIPPPEQLLRSEDAETSVQPTAAPTAQPEKTPEETAPAETGEESGEQPAPAEETPEPTLDPNSPAARAAALGLPAPPEIDVNSWEFMLANGDHSIGEYAPEQLAYLNQTADEMDIQYGFNPNRCPVDSRIAQPLLDFARGCRDAGLPVYLSSGYRDYGTQAANFTRICQNNGVTDGKDSNGHYITMPAGCSEHQTALCCDITDRYYEIKNASIEQTETFQWLVEHCWEYGFIHRFPSGKEDVTGVMYEPWHFRYVGNEAAEYITRNGLVLEEFLALYGVE